MTGQAGKVARGLRTIGANITQLAQNAKEFDITVNGATKTIQLWNETGTDMLNTYDVLKQISAEWKNMTNAEKSSLAIDLAKKTQMDTFLAVLGNFEDAEKAYTTALLSEGSAWKENAKYMESVEAHRAKLQQAWEQLVLSKPIEDLEKSLLDAGTALLKFANSDVGQTIIKLTAFLAVLQLLNVAFAHFNAAMLSAPMGSVLASIRMLIAGTGTLTGVVDALTASLLANPLFWGAAAVLGITAIIKVIDAFTVSYEEATEALNDSLSTYEQAQSDIESLTAKIEELGKIKSEINEKKLEITDDKQLQQLQQQTDELERQEASLQRQLALAKAKAEIAEKDAQKAAKESLTSTVETEKTTVVGYGEVGGKGGTLGTRFEGAVNSLQNLQDKIIANNREIEKLNQNYDKNKKQIDELTAKNEILKQAYEATYKEATTLAETVQDVSDALGEETKAYDGSSVTIGGLIDVFDKLVGWKTDATDKTTEFTSAIEDEEDALQEEGETVSEASNAWDGFLDNIESIQSAYETLNKAADEYNQNGFITASTLKKLNQLNPEYIAQLEVINGKMQVGNGLLQQEFENEKQLAIDAVLVAKNLRVQAICQQYVNDQTDKTKTASKQAAPKVDELKTSFHNLSIEARKAGTAVQYAYASIGNDEAKRDELQQQLDDVDKWADGMIDSIKAVHLGAVESSKSAASSSKDAWVEAFKEEQRQLKHSLEINEITELEYYERLKDLNEKYFGEVSGKHQKYLKEYQENEEEIYKGLKSVYEKVADYLADAIEQGYEDAINAIKKEEKRVLAEIKAQIEALKTEKQQVLDEISNQINDLKKQKDQVLDYWNSQIDKIKEENNQLQQQNELLEKQQALQQAKAQKVMVMKDGKFQLGENESAVAQAEQALSQYQDQMSYEQQIAEMEKLRDAQVKSIEDRIEALEEYKDYMEQYYDEQIEALEQHYDEVQRQYEAQIEALQEQLDTFKKGAEQQKKIEEARLAARALGINKEAELFKISLENAQKYVAKYNEIMEGLGGHSVSSADASFSTASFDGLSTDIGGIDTSLQTRASGDSNFSNDEIALVGESPNAELVIGSHLNRSINSGKLVNLSKGSGIVNAESTSTLAGLLNGIVTPTNVSNSKATTQSFNFGSISLPNVTDADSFVNTLSHKFNNYAIQYSSNRR